jgi:hypothetical protein
MRVKDDPRLLIRGGVDESTTMSNPLMGISATIQNT